jgi:hypothetical protein
LENVWNWDKYNLNVEEVKINLYILITNSKENVDWHTIAICAHLDIVQKVCDLANKNLKNMGQDLIYLQTLAVIPPGTA